jgi:hypothetical protein
MISSDTFSSKNLLSLHHYGYGYKPTCMAYLLTYLLKELSIVPPLKNFPALYGTRRFNTVFTRALHWSLS